MSDMMSDMDTETDEAEAIKVALDAREKAGAAYAASPSSDALRAAWLEADRTYRDACDRITSRALEADRIRRARLTPQQLRAEDEARIPPRDYEPGRRGWLWRQDD